MKTILTIVVLIIAFAITRLVIWNGPAAAKRIAVLPFESLSSDKENSFFADGVYDGVSTRLAKVANLKVISHNSVAKYRGARNTQEIGRALNVAYVLKGSVRREAGRIILNAQLIDTRTDTQVWAQEYDRDLSDVFALQGEIAQKVAECVATIARTLSHRDRIDAVQTATEAGPGMVALALRRSGSTRKFS
jgi:TolB-like protein